MPRVGQARKRDRNEREIVLALRAVGAEVWRLSVPGGPDLLVRRAGRIWCFEVKTAKGTRTAAQALTQWQVVRTIDEALRAIGV